MTSGGLPKNSRLSSVSYTGSMMASVVVVHMSRANDLDFYIPTRRAFEEGQYEPTTCPLEPGCGERLVQSAVKLLKELKVP
jgi:hypothetical protein